MKPYRPNKLEPKTIQCIFLGYAAQYKSYICYAVKENKLIVSRHVLYDETHFPTIHRLSVNMPSSSVSCTSTTFVVHPNTFRKTLIIPISLPHVFVPPSNALTQSVTQSTPLNNGDLVSTTSTSTSSSKSMCQCLSVTSKY